jgi:hypothetical protein
MAPPGHLPWANLAAADAADARRGNLIEVLKTGGATR